LCTSDASDDDGDDVVAKSDASASSASATDADGAVQSSLAEAV